MSPYSSQQTKLPVVAQQNHVYQQQQQLGGYNSPGWAQQQQLYQQQQQMQKPVQQHAQQVVQQAQQLPAYNHQDYPNTVASSSYTPTTPATAEPVPASLRANNNAQVNHQTARNHATSYREDSGSDLHLSTVVVAPIFVENISELELSALR